MPMEVCTLDKTLLVLGGGPDQLPGVLKAKEMGIYTIVLDGNPDAHCKCNFQHLKYCTQNPTQLLNG